MSSVLEKEGRIEHGKKRKEKEKEKGKNGRTEKTGKLSVSGGVDFLGLLPDDAGRRRHQLL